MVLVIGEILIDIFPDYERIGGAPFNFACHLKQMGFAVRFITRVGNDRYGDRIIERLQATGFDLTDVQIDPVHPTGTVRVALDAHGVPRFHICEAVAYDHLDLNGVAAGKGAVPAMIYFGSLLQRTAAMQRQVQALLSGTGAQAFGFCDINMRPPHVNDAAVAESLRYADLLKLNEEELASIQRMYTAPASEEDALGWLMEAFAIRTVALTRGSRGSRLHQGETKIELPASPPLRIVDTVGAGDGFAAVLAAGFLRRYPLEKTAALAARFASRICTIPGAVPDEPGFYDDLKPLMEGV